MDDRKAVPFSMGLQPSGPKARITDPRIRAAIEGPFCVVRTGTAQAVLLEEAVHEVGTFCVRYQHNYVCISTHGDDEQNGPFDKWLADVLGRLPEWKRHEIVERHVPTVVDALLVAYEHLKARDPGKAQQINKPGSAPAPEAQEGSYPEL